MSGSKKIVWGTSRDVRMCMEWYLSDMSEGDWTMKRLVKAILVKHKIPHRVHDSKQVLGRAIDFFVQGGKSEENQTEEKRTRRWSAKMDMARMLQLMFGSEEGKSKYLLSRQLANRQQLDDHKTKSVKAEYWVNLAKQYNDSSVEVETT